jgi:hypothetical protein
MGSINSDGAFLKATNEDKSIYYKMSAYNAAQGVFGHEAVNELLAYRVASELGVPVPETELVKALVRVDNMEFETYLAVSKSFQPADGTRVSFENFYKSVRTGSETALSVAFRYGWETQIQQMFVFDFLIFNRDRHGANLEVLENGGEKRLSPLFDNGLSFAVSCHTDAELSAFDVTADKLVNNFIGSRSLYENIGGIHRPDLIGRPGKGFRDRLLEGLADVLSAKHMEVVWELLCKRWAYVSRGALLSEGDVT